MYNIITTYLRKLYLDSRSRKENKAFEPIKIEIYRIDDDLVKKLSYGELKLEEGEAIFLSLSLLQFRQNGRKK